MRVYKGAKFQTGKTRVTRGQGKKIKHSSKRRGAKYAARASEVIVRNIGDPKVDTPLPPIAKTRKRFL